MNQSQSTDEQQNVGDPASQSAVVPAAGAQRLYDANFFLAAACQTSFVIANTLMAHYARWVEFLGRDLRDVGWVMGAGAIAGLFLRPWIAQWINHFGPKKVWLSGFLVFAAGSLGNLAIVDIGPTIFVLRSLVVLGAALVFASGLTYIAIVAPVHRQAEAIGIVGIGGFVGMLIGPALGDFLLSAPVVAPDLAGSGLALSDSIGAEGIAQKTAVVARGRSGFTQLFIVATAMNLATIGLVLRLRTTAQSDRPRGLRFADFVASVRSNWPGPILWVDLVFGVCMAIPFGFLATFIDEAELVIPGVSLMGLFFWCYAGSGICLRIFGRRLPEEFGRKSVLVAGGVSMTTGLCSFWIVSADQPLLIMVPGLLCGIAHALMFHTMTSLTIAPFPDDQRGTGSALALMMLDIGTIGGAPVLAYVAKFAGYPVMFVTAGILVIVTTLYFAATASPD